MKVILAIFFTLLLKISLLSTIVQSNEIFGCGGFIKSHADIDFSKVEIKLLTKQGSVKDKTDCSPSNGYYFIPVYDKGEYILKISPPPGWSFEPEQVELNFNGKTDICSQGKDVNFVFKGFGITGKVALAGHVGGAKGVTVQLRSENDSDVRETLTDINGVFSFSPIIPARYIIKASHSSWYLSKSEYTVIVESGNTELPENSLIVAGFDVHGKISSNGQSLSNIVFVLYKQKGNALPSNCNSKNLPKIPSRNLEYETDPICSVAADNKNGEFVFKAVAPGKYLVKPLVSNLDVKLHIKPETIEFQVKKDALTLKENFEITGFSVPGKVLITQDGKGVSGATVKLNGHIAATTSTDGTYILENIKAGNYVLDIIADNLEFEQQNVKISLSNPTLPVIVASAFKVCGQVISDRSHIIGVSHMGSNIQTTASTNSETGEWCSFLPKGSYSVEVVTSDADKANGIHFFPIKQTIEVKSSPISGIIFSQLRATLKGEVKCLPDSSANCKNIEVTLHALDAYGKRTDQITTINASNGKYTFADILPGPYEITIPVSSLCWESTNVLLNINSAEETAPPFIHKGYEVSVVSSHRATMHYTLRTNQKTQQSKSKTIELHSGDNTFCVEQAGEYTIELQGCHIFDYKSSSSFSTRDPQPLMVNAVSHKVGIRVLSTEQNVPLKLLIESQIGKQIVSPALESHRIDGYYSFRYDTYLKPSEEIKIKPQSNIMLFKPESKTIIGGSDCIDVAFNFVATKGLIIQGKVNPAIKDVKITLSFPKNPELTALTTQSSDTGDFKFGPINEALDIELKAEKESYVFSTFDKIKHTFEAHKLCDVIVTVKDDKGDKLSGVLLSLSGAESYRKNLVTGEDGTIKFHSLSPSQYFLRPMMKEYKFNPNSKMIDVKDGESVQVELLGRRVAYSVFGTIISLNGDPFPNVVVEAISDEKCLHHQEESSSESNGQYRIRGLEPGCTYTIRTKDGETNPNVDRTIPEYRVVEITNDTKNINLVAISPITFVDVIARITASSNDFYRTLRIQMYRKGSADSPIYSQRVESPLIPKARFNPGIMVFFPRIPLDGKIYFVELKTSMSEKFYKLNLPVVQFLANTSSVYVELDYDPELKTAEGDLSQNSISALVLVALVAIALFKQDLAVDFLNFVWSKLNNVVQDIMQKQNKKKDNRFTETINYREIEQIAEGINSIKKKKTKKI